MRSKEGESSIQKRIVEGVAYRYATVLVIEENQKGRDIVGEDL